MEQFHKILMKLKQNITFLILKSKWK